MNVEGYAFKKDFKRRQDEMRSRYNEIKDQIWRFEFQKTPAYKKTEFDGTIDKGTPTPLQFDEKDILLLMSDGRLPFGGWCEIEGYQFHGAIYED